jgi:DNA-binding transcriptional LysR family regulator
MNLSQLRFASAVASTGSFTAAAAQCCVTQPTLSNGIAQLEKEFGERLFVRTTRKVALTAFGVHLLPYVNEVLSAQASLVQQSQVFLSPGKRLIRIGTSPLISTNLLGLMIEPFRSRNPGIDVVLREMNMTDLYRLLDDGLLDFVFGVANVHRGSWITTFLYEEPLLFIPRGAAWSNGSRPQSVQLKDIADETYVMVPDACGLSRATRALFRSQRRKLNEYSGEAMSYQVLQEWAALGIGAAILPKSKVAASGHAAFPINDKAGHQIRIGFEAAWSRKGSRSSHLLDFASHLRKVVPAIVAGLRLANRQVTRPSRA